MNITFPVLLISILSAVAGQLLLKRGMAKRPSFRPAQVFTLLLDANVVAGFLAYGLSLLLYFKVLETVPLSIAYPTISLGYAVVVILSSALYKEPVNRSAWLAVALICAGVALVGLGTL